MASGYSSNFVAFRSTSDSKIGKACSAVELKIFVVDALISTWEVEVEFRFFAVSLRLAMFEFFRLLNASSVEVKKSFTFLLVLFNCAPGRGRKVEGLNSDGKKESYAASWKVVLFASS